MFKFKRYDRKRVFTFNFAFSSWDKKTVAKRDVYKVELRGDERNWLSGQRKNWNMCAQTFLVLDNTIPFHYHSQSSQPPVFWKLFVFWGSFWKLTANLFQLRSEEHQLCAEISQNSGGTFGSYQIPGPCFPKKNEAITNLKAFNFVFRVVALEQSTSAESSWTISAFEYSPSCAIINYELPHL